MSAAPEDHSDLYCIGCGYSLRGLPGDQIRCPECGEPNPVSGEPVPERYLARQLGLMQNPAILCSLCFPVALIALAVFVSLLLDGQWRAPSGTILGSGFVTLLLAVIWFIAAFAFVGQYSRRWGGVKVLGLHHLDELCLLLLLGSLWQIVQTPTWPGDLRSVPWKAVGLLLVTTVGTVMLHRPLGRRQKATFREEVIRRARERAREEVKQAMRVPRRK